jgi:hypothetical protein
MKVHVNEAPGGFTIIWNVDISKIPPTVCFSIISWEEFILVKLEESSRVRISARLWLGVALTQNLGQHIEYTLVATVANCVQVPA